ncbi:MAG TPA: EAL domain-containing protein [Sulfuricella sp.]|nr:EAL domain-containing protein [Sulfuricella sp.]
MLMPENDLQDIFLGRQPILDRDNHIVAYELLFRSGQVSEALVQDDLQASAQVIVQAFSERDIASVLGGKKGFINVSVDLLLSDIIELLPSDKVVIELLETIQINEQIISRCSDLKAMGFSLALDDFIGGPQFVPLFDIVEVVKFDLPLMGLADLKKNVAYLKHWPLQLLAEKVEDIGQAEHCKDLGFDLFQGYYYARPVILSGKRPDASKLALTRLVGLVLNDAETFEIEQAFKHDPSLSYNLLRLVNSVAMGMNHKISSLKHAIIVLGRQQLQRWLQLLLFVNQDGDMHSPLLELAATRGRLMELLATVQVKDKDYHGRAFMVGIMSLLDTLLCMQLEDIIKQVNLSNDIEKALLEHGGPLGNLLLLVKKMEQTDFDAAAAILDKMRLSRTDLTQAQMEAMRWANDIKELAE